MQSLENQTNFELCYLPVVCDTLGWSDQLDCRAPEPGPHAAGSPGQENQALR